MPGVNAVGRSAFEAGTGATLNLSEVSVSRHFPFDSVVDVSADASIFFGTIAGQDADLNIENSSISDSFGAGTLAWNGGTANIVSSVISNAGGLSIADGATDGVLNFVNSILYMTGGDDLSQTNRIQAISAGEANITAASILYDALSTSASCTGIAYECNGMPLTATLDGILNFNSSVAVPLNADFAYPGKDSYAELAGGDLRADRYSYVGATAAQDDATLKALFDMLLLETDGDTFDLIDFGVFERFNPLPQGAYPVSGGALLGVIPDAGIGGVNALINPIDGQPLLFDVFGNPRTDARGFRDIGAVQAAPEPQALPVAALLAFLLYRVATGRRYRHGGTRSPLS